MGLACERCGREARGRAAVARLLAPPCSAEALVAAIPGHICPNIVEVCPDLLQPGRLRANRCRVRSELIALGPNLVVCFPRRRATTQVGTGKQGRRGRPNLRTGAQMRCVRAFFVFAQLWRTRQRAHVRPGASPHFSLRAPQTLGERVRDPPKKVVAIAAPCKRRLTQIHHPKSAEVWPKFGRSRSKSAPMSSKVAKCGPTWRRFGRHRHTMSRSRPNVGRVLPVSEVGGRAVDRSGSEVDLGSMLGRSRVDLGSICRRSGVDVGYGWGRLEIKLGWIWGESGPDPDVAGPELGSVWGRSGVNFGVCV